MIPIRSVGSVRLVPDMPQVLIGTLSTTNLPTSYSIVSVCSNIFAVEFQLIYVNSRNFYDHASSSLASYAPNKWSQFLVGKNTVINYGYVF